MFCNVNGIGRLCDKPKRNDKVQTMAEFSIAYTSGTDKQGNFVTSFLRCKAFNDKAVKAMDNLNKGDLVYFQGNLCIDKYNDTFYTSAVLNKMYKLSSAKSVPTNTKSAQPIDTKPKITAEIADDELPF